ncbi:hypothetical protein [Streptomyces sp. NPDC004296]|uniref:hypothetical protein n=1 Tax=Streptomyces sp. NPDC004296 TaxID=3364697 RepID=UPI0036A5EFE9
MNDATGLFPIHPDYERVASDVRFDHATDLQLEQPAKHWTLADLGYPASVRDRFPSEVAVTAPFRILSPVGTAKLQRVVRTLREAPVGRSVDKPAASGTMIRGTVHRSSYIRDLIGSALLRDHMRKTTDVAVQPTCLSHELGHLNIPPTDAAQPAVRWHCDTNAVVLVVNVFDTSDLDGGEFQFFDGPRAEGRALLAAGMEIPEERIVTPGMTEAGWGVLLQGAAVLHRASSLRTPGERVTMASAFDPVDATFPDPNRFYPLGGVPDSERSIEIDAQFFELARYSARRSEYLLGRYLRDAEWSTDPSTIADDLARCVADVTEALDILRRGGISRSAAQALREEKDAELFDV